MRTKRGAVVFLVMVLSALIFPDMARAETKTKATKIQSAKAARTIKAVPGTPDGVLLMQAQALFCKLPATMLGSEKDTPAMIALGKKLYFETAISINKTQSCNSCHPIDNKGAGVDHLKTGKGAEGKSGDRNDPPTVNAGYQIAQF